MDLNISSPALIRSANILFQWPCRAAHDRIAFHIETNLLSPGISTWSLSFLCCLCSYFQPHAYNLPPPQFSDPSHLQLLCAFIFCWPFQGAVLVTLHLSIGSMWPPRSPFLLWNSTFSQVTCFTCCLLHAGLLLPITLQPWRCREHIPHNSNWPSTDYIAYIPQVWTHYWSYSCKPRTNLYPEPDEFRPELPIKFLCDGF
jgi:hypothetical protein